MRSVPVLFVAMALAFAGSSPAHAQPDYTLFESGPVRPIALSPDGSRLFAVNTPDGYLEIYDLGTGAATPAVSVPVGLEPVAVAARNNNEVWVVNHLSDSVSVVDVGASPPRVVRTLLVGDEPRDIVFGGPGGNRAFITTAHRGQNSPYPAGEYATEGIGRADVWVFDATNLGSGLGGDPLPGTPLVLFGDRPRALAVSPDGSRVYAAVFRSGNQTTAVSEFLVCDRVGPAPCTVEGTQYPAKMPLPWQNSAGQFSRDASVMVGFEAGPGQWRDEDDNNWNPAIPFDIPDWDVFEIDANATPPVALIDTSANPDILGIPGVGTILFNMAVNPVNGDVYVSNTDANNLVRFEGLGDWEDVLPAKLSGDPATVRGNLHKARITVLDSSADNGGTPRTEFNVIPRALNKHIDYDADPEPDTRFKSLATPLEMAVSDDGSTIYVAGFGSNNVAFYDTAQLENDTFSQDGTNLIQIGAQPAGLVLDDPNDRLYVSTRTRIYVVDTTTNTVVDTKLLFTPEKISIINGRKFLYDAVLTSSNGEASCSSCHVFGDMDDLAWDLGDPDLANVPNNNPPPPDVAGTGVDNLQPFSANKGPMTTQTLRGLKFGGPQHWRGDRTGPECLSNPADPACGNRAFNEFDVAFEGLLGLEAGGPLNPTGPLNATDMQAFTDFAMQITLPPNPIRNLDNSLTAQQQNGLTAYFQPLTDGVASCEGCHELDRALGKFGNGGGSTFEGEAMEFKVPHLRNAYQKVGMFGLMPSDPIPNPPGGGADTGPQVRATGFLHDGSVDTVASFLSADAFTALTSTQVTDLEALIMAFETDMAPIVGQQITLTNTSDPAVDTRITLLINRAQANFDLPGSISTKECDLIVKGVVGGVRSGWVYNPDNDNFEPDVPGPAWTRQDLEDEAALPDQELTFTCVPPGSGQRMGVNRDRDTFLDGEDVDPDAFNPPASEDCRVGPTTPERTGANILLLLLLGLGCRFVARRHRLR